MHYKVMLENLGLENSTPIENWKAVNNQYIELSKAGIIQPYEYVLNLLDKKQNLFFVDIGAHDGLSCSNSAYMEFFLNWKGICIEPHPDLFNLLQESRNCILYNCCVSDIDDNVDFVVIDGDADALSGIYKNMTQEHKVRFEEHVKMYGGSYRVQNLKSRSLNSILEENKISHIDYLSIDTEGSEFSIIRNIDFSKYTIDTISAENNDPNDLSVRNFLESNGYRYITKCCSDEIYVKNN